MATQHDRLKEIVLSLAIITSLICGWEVLARARAIYIMPPFSSIMVSLGDLLISGQLTPHIIASLTRSFFGYSMAAVLAIFTGVLVGWSRKTYRVMEPTIELLRAVPAIALIPLAILWFGIGEEPKIFIIFIACFWPIFVNTYYGVSGVDDCLIKSARSMNAKESDVVFKVAVPSASPYIFSGLRISLGMSFVLLVASEMIAGNQGLGFLILYYEETFHISQMYAVIILISLLAFMSIKVLLKLEDHLIGWHKETTIKKR